jgi:DNA-binding transcriptional ArsR family regulator
MHMKIQDDQPLVHPAAEELELAAIFRALADPTRLSMFGKVARVEPAELTCRDFGCANKQLASHHLRILREAGLTHTREEGRNRYVRLRREAIEQRFPGLLAGMIKSTLEGDTTPQER